MNSTEIPATLGEAIATEPAWLLAWLMVLVAANLGALLFAVGRDQGAWIVRKEAIAIVISFILAGIIMEWMYSVFGYVRLLGLAHIVAWGPAYAYVLIRRKQIGLQSLYGKYLHFYLVIAGTSLIIDAIDVLRYLLGDGELYLRWG